MPRRLISRSWRLLCTSLRAVSSARSSCAGSDLQCTERNQPSRISCAIPRASLRSVFTGIALKASRTCRVSSNSTVSPASRMPAYSHCDKGPASRPIRVTATSNLPNQPIKASGSLATFASRTIRPLASTTQMLALSSDTSIPRPETPHERNCRLAAEEVKPWFQNVNGEILAIKSQVATKDRELSEVRQKCIAAHPTKPMTKTEAWPQSLCKTETSGKSGSMIYFANPEGDYETALTSIASERRDLQSRIEAKEKERTQRQQSWDQRCLGNPQDSTIGTPGQALPPSSLP